MGIPVADQEMFEAMNREQLLEYIFMQVKNIWRVDGLYFLGIEKRHDMQEATDVDAECWRYMGKTEAKELMAFMGVNQPPDPAGVLRLLRHSSWAVSHDQKAYQALPDGNAMFEIHNCRTQLIRLGKGLDAHPCRQVREGYLKAFVAQCNPALTLETICCPPDRCQEGELWCRWIIKA